MTNLIPVGVVFDTICLLSYENNTLKNFALLFQRILKLFTCNVCKMFVFKNNEKIHIFLNKKMSLRNPKTLRKSPASDAKAANFKNTDFTTAL